MNCCQWNINGNWLASGSTDGLIKIYDIRVMKEMETLRGQNSEVSLSRLFFHVRGLIVLDFLDLSSVVASDA